MIDFNFEYYKPNSLDEAVKVYNKLSSMNKDPLYYSGGTELITMAKDNEIFTKAVIDLKGIPECNIYEVKDNKLITGSSITLTRSAESKLLPVLSCTSRFPADRTARNKISVVGNFCGSIIYKEAILGHLVCDSSVFIYGNKGGRNILLAEVFNKNVQLENSEFIVQISTDMSYSKAPYLCVKKVKQGKGGYPLISMAAIKKEGKIKIAFSGLCNFPFRAYGMEVIINDNSISMNQRVAMAIEKVPGPILNDIQGSSEYRKFVLSNILRDTLTIMDGEGK